MQEKKEIPTLVNEKVVRTDLHGFYDLSSLIDKVSFKSHSMSLGLVLVEKMFMRMLQSDDKSANRKMSTCRHPSSCWNLGENSSCDSFTVCMSDVIL